jgi:hypothetical protein
MTVKKTVSDLTIEELRAERIRVTRDYLDMLADQERALTGVAPEAPVLKTAVAGDVRLVKWPLADAMPVFLETCSEPQTAKEIVEGLKRAGRDFESDKPVRAVRAALKKAMAVNPDVYAIGWAKYFLHSKSTRKTKQIEKAFAKTNGTGGRSTKEHGRRTSEGIAKRRSSGRPTWGPPKKATPELIERAKEMLRTGSTLKDVCKALDVSIPLLYLHNVHALKLRKEGRLRREKQLALGDQAEGENVVRFAKS